MNFKVTYSKFAQLLAILNSKYILKNNHSKQKFREGITIIDPTFIIYLCN